MRIELVACELNPIIVLRDNAPVPPGFFQRTYLSYRYICQHKHCNVTFWLGHLSHQTGIHAGQPQKCSENVRCPTSIAVNLKPPCGNVPHMYLMFCDTNSKVYTMHSGPTDIDTDID